MAEKTSDCSKKSDKEREKHVCPKEKLKPLEEELFKTKKLAEERLNQMKYLQAEFDNYKKWSEKVNANFAKTANQRLVKDLLPFLDEFEKATSLIKDEAAKKGFEMVEKNLFKILKSHGLEKIECLNKPFDPFLHEAMLKKKSDKDEDLVIEEIQCGWKLNGEVIRHSKVVVSEGD